MCYAPPPSTTTEKVRNKAFRFSLWSWFLGLLDYGYNLLKVLGPFQPKFFEKGYGNTEAARRLQDELASDKTKPFHIKKIDWKDENTGYNGITVQEGRFISPVKEHLPPESAEVQFFLVRPKSIPKNKPQVYVILLPATGETDTMARMITARQLASQHGWSTVIVTAPYYGVRKPKHQRLLKTTVKEQQQQQNT